MLRDGGNADEENKDADDVGLEPQDRIGIHGKLSTLGVSSRFAPVTGRAGGTGLGRRRHTHRQSFRAVNAPPTEISGQPVSER
jgi:hypothetical protein